MTKAVQEIVQLQAQVADLQSQLADVPALVAEVVRLRESLDPGKSAAIIDAMFSEANRLGRQQYSSSHALTYLVEEVERLRAENAGLEQAYALHTGAFRVDL